MFNTPLLIRFALLFAVLFFSVPAMAESSWFWQHPYPTGTHINGVQFIDSNNGWIVTEGGAVFGTDDGGITWEELYRDTEVLERVFFMNTSEGWACGEGGILLHTTDGGESWSSSIQSSYSLLSVEFIDGSYGTIVGVSGIIKRTNNGGVSWQTQGSGTNHPIYDVSFSTPTTGWTTSDLGYVLNTVTGGAFWDEQNTGISAEYKGIHFIDELYGFAAGASHIVFTEDGGDSWSTAFEVPGAGFSDLDFATDLGVASGDLGVGVTENCGGSWEWEVIPEHPQWPLNPHLRCLTVPTDSKVISSGDYGIMYTRSVSGEWSQLSSHENLAGLNAITNFNEFRVWSCANNGLIMKSIDGGVNWESQIINNSYHLRSICFPSALIGYCVGQSTSDAVVLKTVDGGAVWTDITPTVPDVGGLNTVDFMDEDNGVAVGSYGDIICTTDGGVSWTEKTEFSSGSYTDVGFGDTDRGWVVGGSGKIICFDFNSDSWSEQTSAMTQSFNALFALNADTVWAVGWNGTVVRTLDTGNFWETVEVTGKDYQDVWFADNGLDGYFTGVAFGETSDGGFTITHSSNYSLEDQLQHISFIDVNNGWGCGAYGRILRFAEDPTGTADFSQPVIPNPGTGIITSPNPFTASSTVSFSLPGGCFVDLDLFDLAGRKIKTIQSGVLPSGEHNLVINGEDLVPGMYFLRLTAGGISETRTMVRIP